MPNNRKQQPFSKPQGKPWRAAGETAHRKRGGLKRRAAPRMAAKSRPRPRPAKRGAIKRTVTRTPRAPVRKAVRQRTAIPKPARPKRVVKRAARPQGAPLRQRKPRPRPASRPVSRPPARGQKVKHKPAAPRRAHPRPGAPPKGRIGKGSKLRAGAPTIRPAPRPAVSAAAAAEIASAIASATHSANALEARATLADVQSEVNSLNTLIDSLPDLLEEARERGYEFGKDLEPRVNDVLGEWSAALPNIEDAIYQQSNSLIASFGPLQDATWQLSSNQNNPAVAQPLLTNVQGLISQMEAQARTAEDTVESLYANISSNAYALQSELNRIDWLLDQYEEASFELAEEESPVAVVKAKYDVEDEPEGMLYLTDQRLIFEQKEEKVTKKVLFIPTEKELVQEVLLEVAEDDIKEVKATKKGLGGHQDHLDFEFAQGDVRKAHFHIDGQDCNKWQRMVEDVVSGKIEEDVAVSAGISVADITGPVTEADIVELQQEVNELQARALLSFAKDALEDMEVKTGGLERQLKDARAKGYLFESDLEDEISSLTEQWATVKGNVDAEVSTQSERLADLMSSIQPKLAALMGQAANPERARPLFLEVQSLAASAEAQAEAAEDTILNQYDDFQVEVDAVSAHLEWVDWMLGALATASFRLYPTEGGVAAAEATWTRTTKQETGILYLTDQRLIFEEREGDFSVLLDAPVAQVEDVDALSEQGESMSEEHLVVGLSAAASVSKAQFILHGPQAEEWQQMIGRAKSGDYASDRAVEIDEEELDRLKNAPTACSACGSSYSEPLLRGQTEITCQYCGNVTRF